MSPGSAFFEVGKLLGYLGNDKTKLGDGGGDHTAIAWHVTKRTTVYWTQKPPTVCGNECKPQRSALHKLRSPPQLVGGTPAFPGTSRSVDQGGHLLLLLEEKRLRSHLVAIVSTEGIPASAEGVSHFRSAR